jgi:chromosome segregation and condensation protein ScpB
MASFGRRLRQHRLSAGLTQEQVVAEKAGLSAHAEPLSAAAPQVLAIVAYEQPVTRADITRIRGVDSDGVVSLLLARGLIAEQRHFALSGASLPLVTTAALLRYLGLQSLAQLPPLLAGDCRQDVMRAPFDRAEPSHWS